MNRVPDELEIYPRTRTIAIHSGDQFFWWCTRDKAGECEIKSVEVGSVMTTKKKEEGVKFMYRLHVLEFAPPSTPMPKQKSLIDPTERIKELAPIKPQAMPAPQPEKPAPPALPSKPLTQGEFGM